MNCVGVKLPEGMKENQKFLEPMMTLPKLLPDMMRNISKRKIIKRYCRKSWIMNRLKILPSISVNSRNSHAKAGLDIVDTKYEFGKKDGKGVSD